MGHLLPTAPLAHSLGPFLPAVAAGQVLGNDTDSPGSGELSRGQLGTHGWQWVFVKVPSEEPGLAMMGSLGFTEDRSSRFRVTSR